jgi:hypothetical protein
LSAPRIDDEAVAEDDPGYGFIVMAGRFKLDDPGVSLLSTDQLDIYRSLT